MNSVSNVTCISKTGADWRVKNKIIPVFWLALCHEDSGGVKLPVFSATKKGKIVPNHAMKAYRGNKEL